MGSTGAAEEGVLRYTVEETFRLWFIFQYILLYPPIVSPIFLVFIKLFTTFYAQHIPFFPNDSYSPISIPHLKTNTVTVAL